MGVHYFVSLECDWCGSTEESSPEYCREDLLEAYEVAEHFDWAQIEIYGEYTTLCDSCMGSVFYCEECGEYYPEDDGYTCDDEMIRCEGCADANHEYIQNELMDDGNREKEWVCENCGVENSIYMSTPTATWTI
jgi:hypothetical protein